MDDSEDVNSIVYKSQDADVEKTVDPQNENISINQVFSSPNQNVQKVPEVSVSSGRITTEEFTKSSSNPILQKNDSNLIFKYSIGLLILALLILGAYFVF